MHGSTKTVKDLRYTASCKAQTSSITVSFMLYALLKGRVDIHSAYFIQSKHT